MSPNETVIVRRRQRDQMSKLLFQCFAIYNNINFPNSIRNLGSKFCQILNRPFKTWHSILKFCPSGEISPNLVTLAEDKL